MTLRSAFAEIVVVVAGILIAFGLDSGWDRAQERAWERAQLTSLRAELESNLEHSQRIANVHRNAGDIMVRVRVWSSEAGEGAELELPAEEAMRLITWRTSEFSLGIVDALRTSGDLGRLRSAELRAGLTDWRRLLDDVAEKEGLSRDYVEMVFAPRLAGQGFVGEIYAIRPPYGTWSEAGPVTLRWSRELSDLVAARMSHELMAAVAQDSLTAETERVLDLLHTELAR